MDKGVAIIVVAHNRALPITAYLPEWGDEYRSFLSHDECDRDELADGVYRVSLVLVDDGPSDWPGAREMVLAIKDAVPVSEQDWRSVLDDEWPEGFPLRSDDGPGFWLESSGWWRIEEVTT